MTPAPAKDGVAAEVEDEIADSARGQSELDFVPLCAGRNWSNNCRYDYLRGSETTNESLLNSQIILITVELTLNKNIIILKIESHTPISVSCNKGTC